MPTVAQRQRQQRAAALDRLAQPRGAPHAQQQQPTAAHHHTKGQHGGHPKASSAQPSPRRDDEDEGLTLSENDAAFSDDDESDDNDGIAFEMDGQDVWTQNYCATCDCLIEPGQGVNARASSGLRQPVAANSQKSGTGSHTAKPSAAPSISRSSSAGLKSKSGTIKARPPSSEDSSSTAAMPSATAADAAKCGNDGSSSSKFKRTHSAGRLHAVGGGGPLAPGKRTGSAGSRLNALSELRPTTKLHSEAPAHKGKLTDKSLSNGTQRKNNAPPSLSRQGSEASTKSLTHSGVSSSNPPSPISPVVSLPRTKKSAMLGSLTPAALKQQEELEEAKMRAPGALYCSERCRDIDEQKSTGLGDLIYYLQQPTSPTSYWSAAAAGPSSSYGTRSNRASGGSISSRIAPRAVYGGYTPETECLCQECMEKNSAGGTVPSGASDTAESSASHNFFGAPQGYSKQRTQSGRIVTPQGLVPPGSAAHWNADYFGSAGAIIASKNRAGKKDRRSAHGDTESQAGTESSTRSDESGSSELWEPPVQSRSLRNGEATSYSLPRAASKRSEAKCGSATAGTVTPAGSAPDAGLLDAHRWSSLESTATTGSTGSSHNTVASPLRLLRQGYHRGAASVDVSADVAATSPQPYSSSFLSRSVASELTDDGASSGVTLTAHPPLSSSLLERRALTRATSRASVSAAAGESHLRSALDRYTDSPAPLENGEPTQRSAALDTLKSAIAQRGGSQSHTAATASDPRRPLLAPSASSTTSRGSNSWLRSSISLAWNSLRGLPSSEALSSQLTQSSQQQQQQREFVSGLQVASYDGHGSPRTPEVRDLTPEERPSQQQTPQQSLVHRPTIKRGNVPAFAEEIGKGTIPGGDQADNGTRAHNLHMLHSAPDCASLPKSLASMQDTAFEEEKRRRRQGRERAIRHQRSKDVTQLPPLLGVTQHPSSSNLHGMRASRVQSSTSLASGASSGSLGGHMASPQQELYPMRPTTPGMVRKSSASGGSLHELMGTSPGRASTIGNYGTSPRRAGLGWGAMTPMAPLGSADAIAAARHAPVHHAHRSGHHQQFPVHGAHHGHHRGGHHMSLSGHHRPHAAPGHTIPLGTVGVLGMHPHGHAPVYGRHATTPVRMSTPSVPEDGGEMSGAALKGERSDGESSDEEDDATGARHAQGNAHGLSRSFGKRVNLLPLPQRPRSGMSMRSTSTLDYAQAPMRPPSRSHTPAHERATSTDDARGPCTKLYPVLDVPNRAPTHDRYGLGWGVAEAGIEDLLPAPRRPSDSGREPVDGRPKVLEQPQQGALKPETHDRESSADHIALSRKKLFYFDTS